MQIATPLYQIADKVSARTGIYTTRQCRRIATQVGKDIVDAQRNNKDENITKQFRDIVHKYVPKARFGFLLYEDSKNETANTTDKSRKKVVGYYHYLENLIIMDSQYAEPKNASLASILSHEFCHYMTMNHTAKFVKQTKMLREMYNRTDLQNIINPAKMKPNFQRELLKMTNLNAASCLKDEQELLEYFSGDKYNGLTSKKRLNAYITSILRYFLKPNDIKTKDRLESIIDLFKDEIYAYGVSENVSEYQQNNAEKVTAHNRVLLYKMVVKILKRERLISMPSSCSLTHALFYRLFGAKYKNNPSIRCSPYSLPTSAIKNN